MKKVIVSVLMCCLLMGCTTTSLSTNNTSSEIKPNNILSDTVDTSVLTKPDTDMTDNTTDNLDSTAEDLLVGDEPSDEEPATTSDIILGDERFDLYLPLLENKRVAIFTNQTGIVGDVLVPKESDTSEEELRKGIASGEVNFGEGYSTGPHILDVLLKKGVNVVKVLTPEHGFRGNEDAGASFSDYVDESTGVEIFSLYRGIDRLESEAISDFDTVVVDIQDVGLRYYTYYLTMYRLMDVCARYDKEVIILDRPNPNGFYVDGPLLNEDYTSGVGLLPICVVHGMTLGELGLMINKEGWLSSGTDSLKLTVISCENYTHSMRPSIICNPSPNIKSMRAVYLYASTCFFENTVVSVGRGTEHPFEIYGCPGFENMEGYDYTFVPHSIEGAQNPTYLEETCYGISLLNTEIDRLCEEGINLNYLIDAYCSLKDTNPNFWGKADKNGRYWIDLLSGSGDLRLQIESGKSAKEIRASWQKDISSFKEKRKPYLLYEE